MSMTIEEFDIQMAISKAVHDFKYPDDVRGEYPEGPQKEAYDRQIEAMKYEQEQRDTARTLGEGE